MNIIEAIKSGKPFRVVQTEPWIVCNQNKTLFMLEHNMKIFELLPRDILRDDFEVKEETTKKITLYRYLVLTKGIYPYYYFTSWNSKKEIDTTDNHNNAYEIVKTETKEIEVEVKGE